MTEDRHPTGDQRRLVPRTDDVLAQPDIRAAVQRLGRGLVKQAVSDAQELVRRQEIAPDGVVAATLAGLPRSANSLRPVVNATGVLVHTNLGRAPLSDAAVTAVTEAAGHTDIEFDLAEGSRSPRGRGALDGLRTALPEAADVHVVNNNAAALLLCALALAPGQEIVVSRGELVEIGDGFRIPDLLAATGAHLHEVGTTNRTTVEDYRAAIGPRTGFVLKVHPSNFLVTGFTSAPAVAELAALPAPLVVDIGSGLLTAHSALPDEPDAASSLRAGAAVVTASADKLLGGPQAGLLAGGESWIHRLRRHPAARALRVDKLTLAALEATVRGPIARVPAALNTSRDELRRRVLAVVDTLVTAGVEAHSVDSIAAVGGGGAPGVELPSAAVSLPARYAEVLRRGDPPVVGRVEDGRCLLDLRSVDPDEDQLLTEAVRAWT
ncbi:L-seryl-tRNA(Sec) selenium transferase [Allosaccharopolyspora coralli]|uniref:L-seryl-tRNA(Sec) selenium transferase n=1 Tax=Allosaccharopolyspora coralli TaxID=2665642 RepID=A0A5Q3QG14_9PSEU|nr:L-seryl-tRNA(Sec) selenium transferase [Allosaccharopolyspora coralli]QGK70475.1 L-seryl-tRNA(Sec) selenium transferase [Allosaccharopolyspora coralli]